MLDRVWRRILAAEVNRLIRANRQCGGTFASFFAARIEILERCAAAAAIDPLVVCAKTKPAEVFVPGHVGGEVDDAAGIDAVDHVFELFCCVAHSGFLRLS